MRPALLLIHFVIFLALTVSADARLSTQLSEVENPGVPVLAPTEFIDISPYGFAEDVVLSTDGQVLFYAEGSEVLDIWAALIHYLQIVLPFLVGLLMVWQWWSLIMRRRRTPLENGPFCAKCAYPTEGLSAEECPECGKPLAGRGTTPGITFRHAMIRASVFFCVGTLLGTTIMTANTSFDSYLCRLIDWRSESLAVSVSSSPGHPLSDFVRSTVAVRAIGIGSKRAPSTVGHVLCSDEVGYWPHAIPNMSWQWMGHQFDCDDDQKRSVIITDDYTAWLDLEANRFVTHTANEQIDYAPVELDVESQEVKDVFLDYTIPVRFRHSAWRRPPGYPGNHPEAPPFQSSELSVTFISVSHRFSHMLNHGGECQVICRLQAGYIVLITAHSIYIHDVETKQWVAELDLSSELLSWHALDDAGLPTHISLDRRTVVVQTSLTRALIFQLP
jgi:hypothetical protein